MRRLSASTIGRSIDSSTGRARHSPGPCCDRWIVDRRDSSLSFRGVQACTAFSAGTRMRTDRPSARIVGAPFRLSRTVRAGATLRRIRRPRRCRPIPLAAPQPTPAGDSRRRRINGRRLRTHLRPVPARAARASAAKAVVPASAIRHRLRLAHPLRRRVSALRRTLRTSRADLVEPRARGPLPPHSA